MSIYGPPNTPPPETIPPTTTPYIINCMNSLTYVWPKIGTPFWFFPTRVEYGQVSGYIWTGRFWTFYGFDPALINEVTCYPTPTLY